MYELRELNEYFTEVDDMFEEAKLDYEFELFTKTCKRTVSKTIDIYTAFCRDTITQLHEQGDYTEMSYLMEMLQSKITDLVLKGKVANEIYASVIKQMNSCSEIDSALALRKDFKIFIENEL